jgi:hypothetical protein
MSFKFEISREKTDYGLGYYYIIPDDKDAFIDTDNETDITPVLQGMTGLGGVTDAMLAKPTSTGINWRVAIQGPAKAGTYEITRAQIDSQNPTPPAEVMAADVTPAPTPAPAPKPSTEKPPKTGGSSATPVTPTGETSELQQFLADHVSLYYKNIPDTTRFSEDSLDDKIRSPGWGPASRAGLSGFAETIRKRTKSAAISRKTAMGDLAQVESGIENITPSAIDPSLQSEVDIRDAKFPATTQGLLDFLKFAWVATHPDDKTGYEAAKEIGLDLSYSSDKDFPAPGTPHSALAQMLAISPVPFVAVKGPGGGAIPAGSSIEIEAVGTTNTVKFNQEFPYGAMLGIGIDPNDKVTYHGGELSADIHSAVAESIVGRGTAKITLKLKGGQTFTADNVSIGSMGTIVEFKPSETAGETSSKADAAALSGQSSQQVNTREGVTEGGTTPAFEMQNVYVNSQGNPALRSPQVVLRKRVGPANDIFELSVREPSRDYILVPIEIRGPLSEAVTHWTQAVLGASVATSGAGQPHVALQKIEWGYKGHFRKYGSGGVAEIILVSYEPSEVTKFPNDVNVISVDQALRQGAPGGVGRNPVEQAIAMYIGSDDNPAGTSIYLSSDLNREMNSFAPAQFRNG